MTPNERLMPLLNLPPAEQFDIAAKLAENVGYVLVREPEHPDSPHCSMQWQPIDTAPMDGTEVLLFTTHEADEYCDEAFSAVQIGSWDHGNEHSDPMWHRAPGWECSRIGEPSHWMPLPQPPSDQ